MTTYDFATSAGSSVTFDASFDSVSLDGAVTLYRVENNADGALVITNVSTGQSMTLSGMSMAALTPAHLVFGSGAMLVGDATTDTAIDGLAQEGGEALDLAGSDSTYLDGGLVIYGMGDGDTISAGNGNNIIIGGSGLVDTADGSDTITIDGTGTTSGNNGIYGNAGNDTIIFTDPTGADATATVYGGVGNDQVISGAVEGGLLAFMGANNDTFAGTGAGGSITVYGGTSVVDTADGDDVLVSGLGNAWIYGNAGADSLLFDDFVSGKSQHLYGGGGNDTLGADVGGVGSAGDLELYGSGGDDSINAREHYGDVTIYGGTGIVDSSDGADTILVGTGNVNADAVVYGNAGADSITSAADLAAGESLIIRGGVGSDVITISGDRDAESTLTISGNGDADTFHLNDSTLTEDATVTFEGFEATDILNVTLVGGDATDLVVTGLGTSVSINNTAGHGNYVFTGYTGNFTATNFALSDDSILLTNLGGAAAALSGAAGNDQIICGLNGDTASGAAGDDILRGGDGADNISGGDGVDTITGGAGNDTIAAGDGGASGGGADSSINGGEGSDSITGGANEDSINGYTGNDTLIGAAGADTLTGGEGADVFSYAVALADATDTNVDLITDAFTGYDVLSFSDLTNANLRGTGVSFASGNADAAMTLGANVGLFVATNTCASFSETDIYAAMDGVAADLVSGDILYVLISDGDDARVVKITETTSAGSLAAADDALVFVARLDGVSTTDLAALTEGNFSNFA